MLWRGAMAIGAGTAIACWLLWLVHLWMFTQIMFYDFTMVRIQIQLVNFC